MFYYRFIFFFCFAFFAQHTVLHAQTAEITTPAKQAIVIDYNTGQVLFEKNPDQQMPTSSMSKVMTMYMVFDALERGDVTLDGTFRVSEKAWKKQGSKMFIKVGDDVQVEDLIRGVIVQSGNDATIALAEGIAGSESAFAMAMNVKAKELGMKDSNFENASGWPNPNHYSTARDLAILGGAIIRDFPEFYKYYAETSFVYNNIPQDNRNPLLYRGINADGVKTGHTEAGGYGVIGSGVLDDRRVIIVVNGLDSKKSRAEESAKLLEWGLKRFDNKILFKPDEAIRSVPVIYGTKKTVTTNVAEDFIVSIPKLDRDKYKVRAVFDAPVLAPIARGDEVGYVEISMPHAKTLKRPLFAAEDVPKAGFFKVAFEKLKIMILG